MSSLLIIRIIKNKVIPNLTMFYGILCGQVEYIKNFSFVGIFLYNIGYLMFV